MKKTISRKLWLSCMRLTLGMVGICYYGVHKIGVDLFTSRYILGVRMGVLIC